MEAKAMAELVDLGVQINDDVDKPAFIEATAPVREQFGAQYSELLARIEAVE
jgi:TRAP-type C4-dicarboxylate transport system substrate-binding protein